VPDSALDLRLGELAVVVPLVLCLLGLSAYPALISGRAFGGNQASAQVREQLAVSRSEMSARDVMLKIEPALTIGCIPGSTTAPCQEASP
jgi:hypothetical protein